MKILRFVYLMAAVAFYKWAMREINPLNKDVPQIVLRQVRLEDQLRRLL